MIVIIFCNPLLERIEIWAKPSELSKAMVASEEQKWADHKRDKEDVVFVLGEWNLWVLLPLMQHCWQQDFCVGVCFWAMMRGHSRVVCRWWLPAKGIFNLGNHSTVFDVAREETKRSAYNYRILLSQRSTSVQKWEGFFRRTWPLTKISSPGSCPDCKFALVRI